MSNIARFAAYAAAFEQSYATDDWSLLEQYFAEDAVYDVGIESMGGLIEGRAAILAYFKSIVDRLDRRFESRELALLEGPTDKGNAVWIRGTATYKAAGVPDFVLELEETVTFAGECIHRLEDRYTDAMKKQLAAYLAEHGPALGISLG